MLRKNETPYLVILGHSFDLALDLWVATNYQFDDKIGLEFVL